jgi:VanZ family protein
LKYKNGIYLRTNGIVFGPIEANSDKQATFFGKEKSISIEIWLKPGADSPSNASYIFCIFDDQQPEIFSLAQVKSSLRISIPDINRSKFRWRWLKNSFVKGQQISITISSDKNETTVYFNGKSVDNFRNYSLVPERELSPSWKVIIGNNPLGQKPWNGEIYGLAIYDYSLTPKIAREHFEKWKNEGALSLLKEKGLVALYPMDERNGDLIHNVLSDRNHLMIPSRFKGLKKNFFMFSRDALRLNPKTILDMFTNVLGFIPFGYLFFRFAGSSIQLRKHTVRLALVTILAGGVLSLVIEFSQAFLPTRYSSITDFIFNVSGTGMGTLLAALFCQKKTI